MPTAPTGSLHRPSFSQPAVPTSEFPRSFFRGLGGSGGNGDSIHNGALSKGIFAQWCGQLNGESEEPPDEPGHMSFSQHNSSFSQAVVTQLPGQTPAGGREALFHIAFIWRDAELSTNFTPVAEKHCTPSRECSKWFCSCRRTVRASLAQAPLLGALVLRQIAEQPDKEACFVPLMPCEGDLENEGDNDSLDPPGARGDISPLPLASETSLKWRWTRILTLLTQRMVVTFNAHAFLMPALHAICEAHSSGQGNNGAAGSPVPAGIQVFDPKVAGWLLCSSDSGSLGRFDFPELYRTHCGSRNLNSRSADREGSGVSSQLQMPGSASSKEVGRGTSVLKTLHETMMANHQLSEQLMAALEDQGLLEAAQEIEMPLVPLLAAMEVHGIGFRPEALTDTQGLIEIELQRLSDSAQNAAGRSFNISSPEQVAATLFDHLRLPKPTATGTSSGGGGGKKHASTREEVLQELVGRHPVVGMILRHRTLAKLKGTYVDALLEFAVPEDGSTVHRVDNGKRRWRVHAEWNQLSVETGRLSATKPALQTIPREPEPITEPEVLSFPGAKATATPVLNVRSAFVASPGSTLVAVDYSQIEMRVLAHFCMDTRLLALFQDPHGDVYIQVAAALLKRPTSAVTPKDRSLAKTCCLGIIYGMGVKELAKRYRLRETDASSFMRAFHEAFPAVRVWASSVKREVHDKGYVTTIANRKRLVPRVEPGDGAGRARAERQAVNSVVQGSASDIMKLSMIAIHRDLEKEWDSSAVTNRALDSTSRAGFGPSPPPRLLLQVHDELIFNVTAQPVAIAKLVETLRRCMEREVVESLGLRVPLAVTVVVGPSWGKMHPVRRDLGCPPSSAASSSGAARPASSSQQPTTSVPQVQGVHQSQGQRTAQQAALGSHPGPYFDQPAASPFFSSSGTRKRPTPRPLGNEGGAGGNSSQ